MKQLVVYAGAAKKTKDGRSGVMLRAVAVVGEGLMEDFEHLAFDLLMGEYPRDQGYYSHNLANDPFVLTDEVLAKIGYVPAETEDAEESESDAL